MLGSPEDYDAFDDEIILFINMALSELTQIGVGPYGGYNITGAGNTWDEFLPGDSEAYAMAKTLVAMKVKLAWDPPQSGATMEALKEQIKEQEWRLSVLADPIEGEPT